MKTYNYHNDPGHGWFAVPRSELVALGITNQISGYSYQKGKTVYLEEDGDAGTWFKAYEKKHGCKPSYKDKYNDGQHPIRSYPSYDPENPPMFCWIN